jgi:hypothetical protein
LASLAQGESQVPCNYLAAMGKFHRYCVQMRRALRVTKPGRSIARVTRGFARLQESARTARRDSVVRIARQSEELDDYGKFIAPEE